MTTALLIVFVIAALVIAGLALEKHTQKTRVEMMKELDAQEPEQATEQPAEVEPTPVVEEKPATVEELVQQQEAPKPKSKRKRGRPAAKKD